MPIPFQIIDNYLPKEDLETIRNIVTDKHFNWYFVDRVSSDKDLTDNFYFCHLFYDDEPCSEHYETIHNIFKDKLDIKSLIRIKANMYTRTQNVDHHLQHVDTDFDHKGAIYYINSNDGFTVLEDGTHIESKENRMLLFNPASLHNSTTCTDTKARLNINFNYF